MYENLVIGLTGSFGSGCGEVTKYLRGKGFEIYSLTNKIKEETIKQGINNPKRHDYQNIGDQLRQEEGPDYLAKDIFEQIRWDANKPVVIKSIRNHHEALFLSKKLANFYLINIDAPKELRYERMKKDYTSIDDFDRDDIRDAGEDEPICGQHVKKCVDFSDIVINNTEELTDLYEKIERYLKLIEEPGSESPTDLETNMAQAYFWSMKSLCLKRKVGAVLVKHGHTIASGFNDTPRKIIVKDDKMIEFKAPTCGEFYNVCYRDLYKSCLSNECKTLITTIQSDCPKCHFSTSNDQKQILEKHLDLCRAIHAEERAILQIAKLGGQALERAALYTTTFPCQLCAKKIVEVGIEKVIYIDPYPYKLAVDILKSADVELIKFEGIKSKKFDNLYEVII